MWYTRLVDGQSFVRSMVVCVAAALSDVLQFRSHKKEGILLSVRPKARSKHDSFAGSNRGVVFFFIFCDAIDDRQQIPDYEEYL